MGYSLPKSWISSAQIERIRLFTSLENFFTFTKFPGFDPELGAKLNYPAMKEVVFGVNVTF